MYKQRGDQKWGGAQDRQSNYTSSSQSYEGQVDSRSSGRQRLHILPESESSFSSGFDENYDSNRARKASGGEGRQQPWQASGGEGSRHPWQASGGEDSRRPWQASGGEDSRRPWQASGGEDSRRPWQASGGESSRQPWQPNGGNSCDNRRKQYSTLQPASTPSHGLIDWDAIEANSVRLEAERWAHLPVIKKDLYVEDPDIHNMSKSEVESFREKSFDMQVRHSDESSTEPLPNPVMTFQQAFAHYPEILQEIKNQGFENPTPIQSQSWPILMQGYDMIGIAQTGTGKTLAFILPALIHIVAQPTPRWQRNGATCLVMAPTRELAQQIEKEISKYHYQAIKCVCVYGQGDKRSQIRKINAKAEIIVATPGRLNEFVEKKIVNLSSVSYLVLDEADRMLDMGFEPQIRKIIIDIRPDRQSVMTSATWPEGVRDMAGKLMKNPIHVVVGSLDLKATHTVTQHVIICDEEEKKDKLVDFIHNLHKDDKAIVFVSRKSMVDHLSVEMFEMGLEVQSMHGDRDQEDREQALSDLKTGRIKVLIATDVASRGIDIIDITHILNYDCPRDMEEYVHRVGRTGRAGRKGSAYTLFTRRDKRIASKLIDVLEKSEQFICPELQILKEQWDYAAASKGYGSQGFSRYGRNSSNRW
ncbi:hypothetical protein Pmani_028637 [Petrolisthes manimaculis]|uniref:RNA helicase n=1 Tax=Petrolisthes manimaculis TaxID=1843537 RepID=A0AAE1P1N7_9EUCA|nr:hypothetical protein Pmani_028637 [Petrolisthes manimaculis]